ncbi:MAG TPA: histidine kinase, partial [Pasteurellaceae bacterium]|nr:histidine kinase [Pasteurellaceae bacterium]
HQCGYEYCTGNYMASNPRWCQTLSRWKQYFEEWVTHPELEGLLNASVLMDMRAIHGNAELVTGLHDYIVDLTQNNRRFLAFLTANSIRIKPPLSIFRSFVLTKEGENKRLNLKKRAISLLVDLGRIYALAAGISRTMSTEERFNACYKTGFINKATLDNALGAYEFVCDMRFKYQLNCLQNQQLLSNYISPDELTSFERNHLKDAFRLIAKFQEAAEMRFSYRGIMR